MKVKSISELEIDIRNSVLPEIFKTPRIFNSMPNRFLVNYVSPRTRYTYERRTKRNSGWHVILFSAEPNNYDVEAKFIGAFNQKLSRLEIVRNSLPARVLARTFYDYLPHVHIVDVSENDLSKRTKGNTSNI